GMIKLDAMENPFPMPNALHDGWQQMLANATINRYPDADMVTLRQQIADLDGLSADQVLLGNGSDELIQMVLMAANGGACATPTPTFVMYQLISRWLKRAVITLELNGDFQFDPQSMLRTCGREKAAVIFLACPNNPTGNMWPLETVRAIAQGFNGMVVIDEAYRPFADRTHTDLISPNVLILRTFSKMGWAGLRLGYLLGDSSTIAQLNKVRLPYNINTLTQQSALLLLRHRDLFRSQCRRIVDERERVQQQLAAIDGVHPFPSQANFILVRVADAPQTFNYLKGRGILVKNLHQAGGVLANCLRITIGTAAENSALLSALEEEGS
ncbi:MAG: histidinol-phosphate transaminase, partial [Mariprofundales bacterium]|nr:histidinol-phosphate transaminase [Mariprofundales bacterium]